MPEMELVDSVPAPAPAEAAAPSPTPTEAPAEPATSTETAPAATPEGEAAPATEAPVVPTEPAAQLFKLPDGREVDAAGLQREYENLLPEFTRKSQELAALKTQNQPQPITTEEPEWMKPDYSPSSWKEAIEIAKQEALKELVGQAQAQQQAEAAISAGVEAQLTELKTADPKLDENSLFAHAVKYGFTDLRQAHSNWKDLQTVALTTEQRVLKNLNNRADPVATVPAATAVSAPTDYEYDPARASNFRTAQEFLDSIKRK